MEGCFWKLLYFLKTEIIYLSRNHFSWKITRIVSRPRRCKKIVIEGKGILLWGCHFYLSQLLCLFLRGALEIWRSGWKESSEDNALWDILRHFPRLPKLLFAGGNNLTTGSYPFKLMLWVMKPLLYTCTHYMLFTRVHFTFSFKS